MPRGAPGCAGAIRRQAGRRSPGEQCAGDWHRGNRTSGHARSAARPARRRRAVVALTEECRQRLTLRRQFGEHRLASFDVGPAAVGGYRINAQRPERMSFRSNQPPAPATFFRAEETAGFEHRPTQQAAETVARRCLPLPVAELCGLGRIGAAQLLVGANLFRPVGAAVLAIAIDQAGQDAPLHRPPCAYAETSEQDALGSLRRAQGQAQRPDPGAVQRALHAWRQQHPLTFDHLWHQRPRTHAESLWRNRPQRHQQGLRRACRKLDGCLQPRRALLALDRDLQGHVPAHGVLDAQAHVVRRGPVPTALRRTHAQGGPLRRAEGDATENVALRGGLRRRAGQVGILKGDADHGHRLDEVEQHLLGVARRQRRGHREQAKKQGKMPTRTDHEACFP